MIDTLIVGSGPSGLSAAIYTSRAGLSTEVLEGDTRGGLLTTTEKVDNYLGLYDSEGIDMAHNFLEHSQKFGATLVPGIAETITVDADGTFYTRTIDGNVIKSLSVIYAAGSTPRKLGITGEELSGVSYCATCDGMFFEDEDVVIVGGGETAAEDALYLSQLAKNVTVLVRGDTWRATEPAVQKLVEQDNVKILMNTSLTGILGDDEVSGVSLNNGRVLSVTGVFVAIGQKPNSEVAESHTTLLADGFIHKSDVEGFFVTGDVMNPDYRQVVIAAGEGAKTGINATRYILNKK